MLPESTTEYRYGGYDDDKHHGFHHLTQGSWTYPATSRLLFDAGVSFGHFLQPNAPVPGVDYETDVNITDVGRNISYGAIAATAYSPNYSIDPEGHQRSRNLAQCGANPTCNGTVTLNNLFEPNTEFADRLTQLDVRLTKAITVGRTRLQGMFDLYNVLNASTVLALQLDF